MQQIILLFSAIAHKMSSCGYKIGLRPERSGAGMSRYGVFNLFRVGGGGWGTQLWSEEGQSTRLSGKIFFLHNSFLFFNIIVHKTKTI